MIDHKSVGVHSWDFGSLDIGRQRMLYIDLGTLGTKIIDSLLDAPSIVLRSKFSLVHIAAPQKKFSVGVLGFVPPELFTLDTQLAFTFVIDGQVGENDIPFPTLRPKNLLQRKRHIFQWSMDWLKSDQNTGSTFITLLFRKSEIKGTGITNIINFPVLFHLYEAIGLITNNWIRNKNQFNYGQDTWTNYDDYFRGKDLSVLHNSYSGGLRKLVRNTPFNYWFFNQHIWRRHPNMIVHQALSHYTVYFYLKHIHSFVKDTVVGYRANVRLHVGQKLGLYAGGGGMLDILTESVKANQYQELESESWEEITQKKASAHLLGDFESADPDEIYRRLWS